MARPPRDGLSGSAPRSPEAHCHPANWAATQAMGLEIDLIEETEKLAKIAQDEIDAKDNLYAQMQSQSKYSYGQLTHSSLSGVLTF